MPRRRLGRLCNRLVSVKRHGPGPQRSLRPSASPPARARARPPGPGSGGHARRARRVRRRGPGRLLSTSVKGSRGSPVVAGRSRRRHDPGALFRDAPWLVRRCWRVSPSVGSEERQDLIQELAYAAIPVLHALQLLDNGHGSLTIEASRMTWREERYGAAQTLQVVALERDLHTCGLANGRSAATAARAAPATGGTTLTGGAGAKRRWAGRSSRPDTARRPGRRRPAARPARGRVRRRLCGARPALRWR